MKTYLTYGFGFAAAGLVVSLLLYFAGLHSDPAKVPLAQGIGFASVWVIALVTLMLGIRARRAEVPATEEFGYGRALGAGVMIAVFGGLYGCIGNYLYFQVINPGFNDVLVQAQVAQWEAKGLTASRIEQAEKMMRTMMHPGIQAAMGCIMTIVMGTVVSLFLAAFLRRPAGLAAEPPLQA